jgi:hypothetical protein
MDDATLAVVGSIAAALLGSLAGATINQRAGNALERRREARADEVRRVRLRAAARLVFIELQGANVAVENTLERQMFFHGVTPRATRGVLLAEGLSDVEFDAVASACGRVAVWQTLDAFDAEREAAAEGVYATSGPRLLARASGA